ncbi:MAG: SUMF1/EgtB/PvdO family nonheme iron enzyme [Deltaproteobacteria bacterium]|nr:SUMF1/EgtB/PvdO family nonheme iron enzyme [Deltaproteobacteria bacterium]
MRFFAESAAGFGLPPPESPDTLLKSPAYPVFGISWHDATAFACWRSKRDRIAWTLPHEEEWEKAARGVDARVYPCGNDYDGTYSHTNVSVPGGMNPLPVGSFPVDESPYGVRDMAGGVATWILNSPDIHYLDWSCLRGGAWSLSSSNARSAWNPAIHPSHTDRIIGLRLAARPWTDPA